MLVSDTIQTDNLLLYHSKIVWGKNNSHNGVLLNDGVLTTANLKCDYQGLKRADALCVGHLLVCFPHCTHKQPVLCTQPWTLMGFTFGVKTKETRHLPKLSGS